MKVLGRLVLELAFAVLAIGVVLAIVGLWLTTLPYRRLKRRSPFQARLQAVQQLLEALAGLAAAVRDA